MCRIFGAPAEVKVHWVDEGKPQWTLTCPESIGIAGKKCSFCERNGGQAGLSKYVVLCWDLNKSRWAFLMMAEMFLRDMIEKSERVGCGTQALADGMGPDFLLQRVGKGLEVEALPESVGKAAPATAPRPDAEKVLAWLETRSEWGL